MSPSGVLGAVLAGGESRRMGRDKAGLVVDGTRLIDRAVSALDAVCDRVVVVSSRSDTPAGPWTRVPDRREPCGPLGAIETALSEAREAGLGAAAILAVDLPWVGAETVARLVRASRPEEGSSYRAVAAGRDGDPPFEPLCAVYPTSALEATTGLLDGGARAARELFEMLGGRVVSGVAGAGVNLNRPEDLAEARASKGR
jgi:molybdopterin-guanine dinucleotide biosynthesis protein A